MKGIIRADGFNSLNQDEMIAVDGGMGFIAGLASGVVVGWAINAVCIGVFGTTPDQEAGKGLYDVLHPGEVHAERQSIGGGGHY